MRRVSEWKVSVYAGQQDQRRKDLGMLWICHLNLGLVVCYSQTSRHEKFMMSLRRVIILGLSYSSTAPNNFCVMHYSFQSRANNGCKLL